MSIDKPEMETKLLEGEAMEAAERWFTRMEGKTCSPAEQEDFERWLDRPENAAAYAKAGRFWDVFDRLSGRADLERLSASALQDTESQAARFMDRRVVWGLAASVGVCALAAGAFFFGQHYTPTRTYMTEAGQRSTIQLDDGSQVILNFATRLDVKLGSEKRQFVLKQGEAVFTVAEDPRRPFSVSAGDGEVTALGTRFQVRHEMRRVTVTLLEGRVAVDRVATRQHVQLNPGEQVGFIDAAPSMTRRTVDPGLVSSWTTGRLKFKATPLAEVLDEVNRYSRTRIRLQDTSFASLPFNGTFEIGDSASVVSALESMLPLEAVMHGGHEIILIKR